MSELKKRAEGARDKNAVLGPDIDLEEYTKGPSDYAPVPSISDVPESYHDGFLNIGVDVSEKDRSGSFVQVDSSVLCSTTAQEGLEVLGITDAINKYDWLEDYLWRLVSVDTDKYTSRAELELSGGYFIRAKKGVKSVYPLQACMYIGEDHTFQNVHNIIIAEEGSELHIITGCATGKHIQNSIHIGVSEFYVKKNAEISFTMIHNWAPEVNVRPRSAMLIEGGGVFINNYICMSPVKSLQTYPTAYCEGKNSTAVFNSIVYATDDSNIDVGSKVVLSGEGSKTEIISRMIAKDSSSVTARGHISGTVSGVKGHLECNGLLLSQNARIHAIPELNAAAEDVELSHEAAVGKVAEKEIQYLMARGLSSDEATALIVRGFLNVEIKGLPDHLRREIQRTIKTSQDSFM